MKIQPKISRVCAIQLIILPPLIAVMVGVVGVSAIPSSAMAQAPQQGAAPIATPAIDETLFKDGALQTREVRFDNWYAKCQEIVKVKRRICNLLSTIVDKDGAAQGSVLVATTDNGSPAMMIAISSPILKDKSINLKSNYSSKIDNKVVKVAYAHTADPSRCDPTCKVIIPLDPKLVFILNAGVELTVEVPYPAPLGQPYTAKGKKDTFVPLIIRGEGFAAALKASTEGW
jgi:invasion protein IalB